MNYQYTIEQILSEEINKIFNVLYIIYEQVMYCSNNFNPAIFYVARGLKMNNIEINTELDISKKYKFDLIL
jgi:hypothetical protein